MRPSRPYWFPAKTHGWGWGAPVTWQGWLTLAAYLSGLIAAGVVFAPGSRPVEFFACVAGLSVALLLICLKTGEPPRWRMGRG